MASSSDGPLSPREAAIERYWRQHAFGVLTGGFAFFEAMYAATRLGLFTFLRKNPESTIDAIATGVGLALYPTKVLLQACCALHLVRHEAGRYANEEEATALDGESPHSILPSLEAFHSIIYRPTHHLHASLVGATNAGLAEIPGEGPTLYERLEKIPELDRVFHGWMAAVGRMGGLGDKTLPPLDGMFRTLKHVVDYGGGDASNAITLCTRYPKLTVTIFDLPKVCEMARANIEASGLGARIRVHEGDFLKDAFLEGADGILFSHIFNIYSPEKNLELVRKSHAVLPDNGLLVVFNSVANEGNEGPLGAAMLSIYFLALATGEGRVYPLSEIEGWMREGGFAKSKSLRTAASGNHAFVVGMK